MKKLFKYTLLIFQFFCFTYASAVNGKLMLVGGGSEEPNGWSDAPYTWAVNEAPNKKVAVIAFTSQTEWLPQYFVSLGALSAKNFTINSSNANLQSTYDSLMNYDMFFFKGGDQYNYYLNYKNTLTSQAIEVKFNSGGVIAGTSAGMAILSKVIFTAQNGTVYPYEMLDNINNSYTTLANDFLNLFPDYIFDSHFVERARLSRLTGFISKWKNDTGQNLGGIGVDDRTAIAIYHEGLTTKGKVFGTGAVTIIPAFQNSNSIIDNCSGKQKIRNLEFSQLLNGCIYDFNSHTITNNYNNYPSVSSVGTSNSKFICTSSNIFSQNINAFNAFKNSISQIDTIILITSSIYAPEVNSIIQYFSNSNFQVKTYKLSQLFGGQVKWSIFKNFIFCRANQDSVVQYCNTDNFGIIFKQILLTSGVNTFWYGDNSMIPFKTMYENYSADYAAYNGNVVLKPGLKLFPQINVFPRSFSSDMDWENGASILPYSMMKDTVDFGFYLDRDTYLNGYYTSDSLYVGINSSSSVAVLQAKNNTQKFSYSITPSVPSGNIRQVCGFDKMLFHAFCSGEKIFISRNTTLNDFEKHNIKTNIYPNPSSNVVFVQANDIIKYIKVYNIQGALLRDFSENSSSSSIDISSFNSGIYFLEIETKNAISRRKILIQK